MTEAPSRSEIILARMAVALIVGLILVGAVRYGFSAEVRDRVWVEILARPGGPMTFRFILQPAMATIAALRDGVNDARLGRSPFFWSIVHSVGEARARLSESIVSTARVVILGVVMDGIYQWKVLNTFYPGEAAIVALSL